MKHIDSNKHTHIDTPLEAFNQISIWVLDQRIYI